MDVAPSKFRKILVSVKFLSAILGPEVGAPILWTPGKNALFLQEKPMSTKFLLVGGGILGFGGGGECRFYFYGREDFSDKSPGDTNIFWGVLYILCKNMFQKQPFFEVNNSLNQSASFVRQNAMGLLASDTDF